MRRVFIDTAVPYEVLIEPGLLDRAGDLLQGIKEEGHIHIVSDDNVAPLYADRVIASFEKSGFSTDLSVVKAGEGAKDVAVWQGLLETWAKKELHRRDLICALGGGVVGDLAGFAAASYQRGCDFIQIPTTFLAAIDSSVGGKTALNLKAGKNLVGAFHQPRLVLCDPNSFKSLDQLVFKEGIAEALKYGILADPELFRTLANNEITPASSGLETIIERCVSLKNKVVSADTFDRGQRQILNLGHTPAHAIESLSDYRIPHGSAVATGLAIMTRAAESIGAAQGGLGHILEDALRIYDFSLTSPYSPQAMAEISRRDKKAGRDHITIVLPKSLGEVELRDVSFESLQELYECGKEPLCK